MYAKHKIYAAIFNILRKFPQRNNKITLLTNKNHSFEANLEYIAKELENRNNNGKNYVSQRNWTIGMMQERIMNSSSFLRIHCH